MTEIVKIYGKKNKFGKPNKSKRIGKNLKFFLF